MGSFAPRGCNFFFIELIFIQTGLLGVVRVLTSYLISKIKNRNGGFKIAVI